MSASHPYDAHVPVPFGPRYYDVEFARDLEALVITKRLVDHHLPSQRDLDVFVALDSACRIAQDAFHAQQRAAA